LCCLWPAVAAAAGLFVVVLGAEFFSNLRRADVISLFVEGLVRGRGRGDEAEIDVSLELAKCMAGTDFPAVGSCNVRN
jgi:hypothetical protein